ncbi:hypothetical protein [Pedobacter miscanthi]|uniref:hypothetical protein n=1 Tax=Pedobacter miscanthi TaxID=2259170 RepID=UPI0029319837|nr:hypothetical protein [Pedobacter miscanthi]
MSKKLLLFGLTCLFYISGYCQKKQEPSLVPAKPSEAPDYFCIWNVQGYVTSYESSPVMRKAMNEQNVFGNGKYEGWANMFSRLHKDLYLVLDDAWDTPLNGDKSYYGSLIVDSERFPSLKDLTPEQRLGQLTKKTKDLGWKGLGLWICAQQAPKFQMADNDTYWTERLNWMKKAGVSYWKVDWGKDSKSAEWRTWLTKIGKQTAPDLIIEQAMTPATMATAVVYRTYDVENIISVPHTIDRVAKLLTALPKGEAESIINCEDEPYIAVGLGCAIGIMRHPFIGNLPNGAQDHAFPPVGRDLKKSLDEEIRAVLWHRIALPFGINKTDFAIDTTLLHDYWTMKSKETWLKSHDKEGYKNEWQAPAIITRGLKKPVVSVKKGELKPYILASKYPNGSVAIAAIGRTIDRNYLTPRADVTLEVENLDQPFGIFGHYNTLTLELVKLRSFTKVLAQDLAGEFPLDITKQIKIKGNKITIPGKLIDKVGLSAASPGDQSAPGMVLVFQK